MGPARAAVAAAVLVGVATAPGQAADGPGGLTDLRFGRLLFEAGRLHDARAFLLQARPARDEADLERRFLLGLIDLRTGRPRAAARIFEAILVRRPDWTRVRLELATAYYAAERDDRARHHFERALADRLPSSVEADVERFLDRIDNRRRWSVSFSAALAPESNPARRTDRETVRIGGVPFRLDTDSREASGTGVRVSAGVAFHPVIVGALRGAFAASGSAKQYRRRAWNEHSLSLDAGAASVFDRSSLSGGLRVGRRWIGNEGYSRSLGPWMRGDRRVAPATRLGGAVEVLRFRHDRWPDLDGWRWTARPFLFHAFDRNRRLEAWLDLEISTARGPALGSRMAGVGLSLTQVLQGGIQVSLGGAVHQRRYDGRNPLFDRVREDLTLRPSLEILHPSLHLAGFAPWIGYSFERTRSSIAVHAFRNHAVLVGVSQTF